MSFLPAKSHLLGAYESLSGMSIRAALREQRLSDIYAACEKIVPDLSDQYTSNDTASDYRRLKTRAMHAFQTRLMLQAVAHISPRVGGRPMNVVDIGDSSGNHLRYLRELSKVPIGNIISINLDPVAVEKVKRKGGDAMLCRAEELHDKGMKADLWLSFETIEHLSDPVRFLHSLAKEGAADHLLFTVPYRSQSQVGFHQLRNDRVPEKISGENLHILELCPADWKLLAWFSGWAAVHEEVYYQYPRFHPFRFMAGNWRKRDFEGFFGVLLQRDMTVANTYTDW